jgi:large subunit ribosomal protein L10
MEISGFVRTGNFFYTCSKGGEQEMVDVSKKAEYVAKFQEKFEKSKVVVLADCEGLNVEQMTALRKEIRNLGDEIKVVKNKLVRRALKNVGREELGKYLVGSTAITFGYNDPAPPVKALFDFAEKAKKFKFKVGMLGEKVLSVKELENLSKLPARPQMLSILLSVMIGPLRNLVSVTQGPIRKLVYALEAIRQKKEKEAK